MRRSLAAAALVLALGLAASPSFAETKLRVTVQKTQLRESAGYLGSIVANLSYGEAVTVLSQPKDAPKDWVYVLGPDGRLKGWVNRSALTAKTVSLSSGGPAATQTASSGDIALAGKGFNSDVEAEFKSERSLDYSAVDLMQAYVVPAEEIAAFRDEGGLMVAEAVQ